ELGWFDFSSTNLVEDGTFDARHLDPQASQIAPLVGPGSLCYAAPGARGFSPAAGTKLPVGTTVVLTGGVGIVDPTRPVVGVSVDGVPAQIDAAGHFFLPYVVKAGVQVLPVELRDRCGTIEQSFT